MGLHLSFAHVSLPLLAGALFLLFAAVTLALIRAHRSANEYDRKQRDWSTPAVDSYADLTSPFHRWDPRFKLASLLFYWFCIASLGRITLSLVAFSIAVGAVLVARIPLLAAMKRLSAIAGFILMLSIVMPLTVPTHPGDPIVRIPYVSFLVINVRGLLIALHIGLKAAAIALMMEPALATTPFPVTLQALSRIGVPESVCQMLSLTHRYVFVFRHEAKRMNTGMKVRGFVKRTNFDTLRTIGNFLGMLFVRSFDRTDRVYQAMLSRGYNGTFPVQIKFQAKKSDWIKGAVWAIAGIAFVLADRWNTIY